MGDHAITFLPDPNTSQTHPYPLAFPPPCSPITFSDKLGKNFLLSNFHPVRNAYQHPALLFTLNRCSGCLSQALKLLYYPSPKSVSLFINICSFRFQNKYFTFSVVYSLPCVLHCFCSLFPAFNFTIYLCSFFIFIHSVSIGIFSLCL